MFEKMYSDGKKVQIENGVIALYAPDGSRITCANVDFYLSESGYNCPDEDSAADLFHRIYGG